MKKLKLDSLRRLKRGRPFPVKPIVIIVLVSLGTLFTARIFFGFLRSADYFKIKEIIFNENNITDLSFFMGENIFAVNLETESMNILRSYPAYRKIRLVRILPNRLFVDFVKRKPVGIVKLYRQFCVDQEGVFFDIRGEVGVTELPLITGLETKIFGAKSGRRYNIKELTLALNIIRELRLNRALRDYQIKRVDVGSPNCAAFFIAVNPVRSNSPKTNAALSVRTSNGVKPMEWIEVKLGEEEIRNKINILANFLIRARLDTASIKYIDLRFKESVIKLKETMLE